MIYFLSGKNIYLRAFSNIDIQIWYNWFNDPEVTRFMNKGIFPNYIDAQEAYLKSMTDNVKNLQLAICQKKNNTLVGLVGIHMIDWVHRHGDVSILIGEKDFWGKGIASEAINLIVDHAFNKMNLNKLTAGMVRQNIGTQKSFENNGFVLEGTRREQFHLNGKYQDVLMYGLLRREWKR